MPGGERFETEIGIEGSRYRACVAWSGESSGYGLLYFHPVAEDESDRRDRRSVLEPGTDPRGLDEDELGARFSVGKGLTPTERRFRGGNGRHWLAQSSGPVWADGGVAEGNTGILFTSLDGPFERARAPGGHVAELSDDELRARCDAARSADAERSGEIDETG